MQPLFDLSKIPHTKDGVLIFLGDEVWFAQGGYDDWPWIRPTKGRVKSLSLGKSFSSYEGDFTVSCDDWEGGNLECYHSFEEVPFPVN